MDSKQFHRRVWAMVVLLALMVSGMGFTLYDLQINQGAEIYENSQHKIAETLTTEAARGQLLDRNGQLLTSNRVIYQVTLDLSLMGKKAQDRNAVLLSLVRAARASGVEWADTLTISKTAPFTFTTDTPYYFFSEGEDGTAVASLTRLGRLAVYLDWIDDPTADSEPEPEPDSSAPVQEEPGFWEKIKRFFTGTPAQAPPPAPENQIAEDSPLPDAQKLLGLMCAYFDLAGEGALDPKKTPKKDLPALNIGDLDPADARAVAGILYELTYREKINNWPPYVFAQDVDIDFISRVKELSLPGVVVEATTVRQYHTTYAAHLLGRVDSMSPKEWEYYQTVDEDGDGKADYQMNDEVGKEGAELAFESYLRGTPGVREVERNTTGKIVSEKWVTEPQPGDNVVLTLDIGLQGFVENTLATSLPKFEREEEVGGAACVVLDVDKAEVLASASYPTFDLANYSRDFTENAANPLHPLSNRALQGTYAPGSTFKMVTAVAGLEETGEDGKPIITPTTRILDEGRYTYYPGVAPQCWLYRQRRRTHGWQNVSQAITNSCNYFFFDVGRRVGIERLSDDAARFGLGQKTGVELSESKGVMAGPEYTESHGGTWYEGSTLSVAIGQESSQFTPIQLANYIATLVNGGTRNAAHLLKEVKSSDFTRVLYTQEPEVLSVIDIQDKNLNAVKAGMLELTTKGSVSKYFSTFPFQVGAKTGSAQVDGQVESNAIFVCFAPFDDPEVAMALVVEHGGSGSDLGAIASDILSYYFSSQETREEVLTENTLIR